VSFSVESARCDRPTWLMFFSGSVGACGLLPQPLFPVRADDGDGLLHRADTPIQSPETARSRTSTVADSSLSKTTSACPWTDGRRLTAPLPLGESRSSPRSTPPKTARTPARSATAASSPLEQPTRVAGDHQLFVRWDPPRRTR